MALTTLEKQIAALARRSRQASLAMADVSKSAVKKALLLMADTIESERIMLQRENAKDLKAGRIKGLSAAMLDRLSLSDKVITSMTRGLREVAALKSPVGDVYDCLVRKDGLEITKVRVPIGVICIVYESRPNVTVDAAAICLKSQNAVILRGGSEAFHSNRALGKLFSQALQAAGLPADAVQIVPTTDRAAVELLLGRNEEIDLVIPRGGEELIRMVVEKSRIPVIKHYKGVCHIYVSHTADMQIALPLVINAKVQRPGVCNAMETLLIDRRLPRIAQTALVQALLDQGVALFGDPASRALDTRIGRATEDDWYAEYLDLRLAVRIVDNVNTAIDHINTYGSRHTDAIVSASPAEIKRFVQRVDSASVMVNASTRLADGGEYGMGCEIGISTDKLHSRGPMGVNDLTIYKWIVTGTGHIRV